jgi:hypothetical protein
MLFKVYLHTNCIAVMYNVCAASRSILALLRVLNVIVMSSGAITMVLLALLHCRLISCRRDVDAYAAQRIMNM